MTEIFSVIFLQVKKNNNFFVLNFCIQHGFAFLFFRDIIRYSYELKRKDVLVMKSRVLKIIISVVVAFMIFALCMPVALAAETSGACGENAKWSYNSDTKCLTISGAGDMYDDMSPWNDFYISSVIIEKGITRIGAHAFEDTSVFYAIIPEGVTTIGAYAFSSTPLFEVMIPASVRMVEEGAFEDRKSVV